MPECPCQKYVPGSSFTWTFARSVSAKGCNSGRQAYVHFLLSQIFALAIQATWKEASSGKEGLLDKSTGWQQVCQWSGCWTH